MKILEVNDNKNYLSLANTKCLWGILALLIIITHIRGSAVFLNNTYIGSLFTICGYPSLGLFFFLTGYGLRESFAKKEHYAERFFVHRILPFYLDSLLFLLVYIVFHIFNGADIRLTVILRSLTWGQTYINNGWYLQTTLLIYVVFWIAYRTRFSIKQTYMILIAGLLIYVTFCIAKDMNYWAQLIIGLPLGYLWSVYYNKIEAMIQKYYWLLLFFMAIVFSVTMISGQWLFTGFAQFIVLEICVGCLCILCLLLLRKIPIQCAVTKFLGEISLEIYVFHGIYLTVFGGEKYSWSDLMIYLLLVVVCTIPTAMIMHKIVGMLNKQVEHIFQSEFKKI